MHAEIFFSKNVCLNTKISLRLKKKTKKKFGGSFKNFCSRHQKNASHTISICGNCMTNVFVSEKQSAQLYQPKKRLNVLLAVELIFQSFFSQNFFQTNFDFLTSHFWRIFFYHSKGIVVLSLKLKRYSTCDHFS